MLLLLGDPIHAAMLSASRASGVSGPELLLQMNVCNCPERDSAAQAALEEADAGGRRAEAATWRRRMHRYLDALFRLDPEAADAFHHYQARLMTHGWGETCL